jgi:predicted ATPase/DNA-binding CsgD family transcriptional regulator
VTFLLTDLDQVPGPAAARPGGRELVAATVAEHGGVHPGKDSDGAVAVFASAADAVACALALQRALPHGRADGGSGPAARLGLHTGEAVLRGGHDYAGAALQRCARLRDVARRGMTLLSSATASVVADALPEGSWLADRGAHRLRDLSRPERVYELRHPDLPEVAGPLLSLDALANNLPTQLTSFVGRSEELGAVELLLTGERLVTLTGSGGCGKTRLALQAAAELADRWPDGAWWIDLAPVTDASLVAEMVASTLGALVEPVGGPLRSLGRQLRDRRLLLCLDNCEHLIDASAELAEAVLSACPEVTILATSREPLGVAAETVWRVPSLAPGEAMSLFAERASRVRPWFSLDATNEAAVRTMCDRLDGIPLAIELAAAWLQTLTPAQIAAGLDDRFALLVRGARGALPRHQTLAASMAWSHDLLDEVDRVVFRRLSVFSGGFTLDAARAVAAGEGVGATDVLAALGRLIDKSLVVVDEDEDGREARYRLLETVRQYAGDRLEAAGEAEAARDRHLDHFLAFAEAAHPEMVGADQDVWLARVEAEHDNLRAALDWGLAAEGPERGRRLAAALFWLWYQHGHAAEGIDFIQRALDRAPGERSTVQATLLAGIAAVAIGSRRFSLIAEYAQQGLEIATAIGDQRNAGRCLLLLAVAMHYIDFDAAQQLLEASRTAAEAAGDTFVSDRVVVMEGVVASARDRYDEARPRLEEGIERCLRRGDRGFATLALDYRVDAATQAGDLALARRLATEARTIAEPLGDYFTVGLATSHLAFVVGLAGDVAGGHALMRRIVDLIGDQQDLYVPRMARVLGALHLWSGDLEDAVRWYERDVLSAGLLAESLIVARSLPGYCEALRRLGRLDDARREADRTLAIARKMGIPQAEAAALEQAALVLSGGDAGPDDLERATDLHHQALTVRVEGGLRLGTVDSLGALGRLAVRTGQPREAARLLAAGEAARATMGYPHPPVEQPDHEAAVADLHAALGEGADAAWAEGAELSLDEAVNYARRSRGTRGRPSAGWASLTPTELDVVAAVADGLTNPEIGARLFMSRATVKTHLSHVYSKLGVANRTELASLAARHD